MVYKPLVCVIMICSMLALKAGHNQFAVDFTDSMSYSRNFRKSLVDEDMSWRLSKQNYDAFIINNFEIAARPRIPKIIHQIWLGSAFPEKSKKLQATWKAYHPDWIYILWTEKEIEEFGLTNKVQYDAASNYGEKADIVRYEVLYRMGGLYVDADFECLKPFDILHSGLDFYAGIAYETWYEVYNGLIGSVPGHPILKTCIDSIKNNIPTESNIFERTGTYLFTRAIAKHLVACADRTVLFPVTYFYPWPSCHLYTNDPHDDVKPESFGIHHWHRSWFPS